MPRDLWLVSVQTSRIVGESERIGACVRACVSGRERARCSDISVDRGQVGACVLLAIVHKGTLFVGDLSERRASASLGSLSIE